MIELEAINDHRRERGLESLSGIVVTYVLAEDGERISSTVQVEGEIGEHGGCSSNAHRRHSTGWDRRNR